MVIKEKSNKSDSLYLRLLKNTLLFNYINFAITHHYLAPFSSKAYQYFILRMVDLFIFMYLFIYSLERGREGEREVEKHQCVVASCTPATGDLAPNPGMCPDWESIC